MPNKSKEYALSQGIPPARVGEIVLVAIQSRSEFDHVGPLTEIFKAIDIQEADNRVAVIQKLRSAMDRVDQRDKSAFINSDGAEEFKADVDSDRDGLRSILEWLGVEV